MKSCGTDKTGERGHYELAAGRYAEAPLMLRATRSMSGRGGLILEQMWDTAALPAQDLFPDRPAGSCARAISAHCAKATIAELGRSFL